MYVSDIVSQGCHGVILSGSASSLHCIPYSYHSCGMKEIHLWYARKPTVV